MPSVEVTAADSSNTGVAYHNGAWVPPESVALPIGSLGVTHGVTAVERMRSYGGRLFEVGRYLDRWDRSTRTLGIAGLPDARGTRTIIDELIHRNRQWVGKTGDFGLLMLACPDKPTPTLIIKLTEIDQQLCSQRVSEGTPIVITSVQQPSPFCWPRDVKVRNRLHYYLADQVAAEHASGALGVLVDDDLSITETSIANVIAVEGDKLVTPQTGQILPGVSLSVVREIAGDLGLAWSEARIGKDRLIAADEVLMTGTSCGVWFARSIDGGPERPPGDVYRRIRREFDRRTG